MTPIDFTKIKCDQEGCTVSIDGKCLEGLELSECRFHHPIEEIQDVTPLPEEEQPKEEVVHKVYSGDALSVKESYSITSRSLTNLIVLAGRADAGKTTLLATIFDLYQMGSKIDGLLFAGSQSMIGLEIRCHESRTKSERREPKTERTIYQPDDPRFIHYAFLNTKNSTIKHLLFTDISGEHFRQLSNSSIECEKFEMVKRADHFVLFFDCDLLTNLEVRHQTKTNGLSILRSLIESKMLSPKTLIEIVFSRLDLAISKPNYSELRTFIDELKNDIQNKFPSNKWNIRFFDIASRPIKDSTLPFGYGIDHLLPIWVEESMLFSVNSENNNSSTLSKSPNHEFSKYQILE